MGRVPLGGEEAVGPWGYWAAVALTPTDSLRCKEPSSHKEGSCMDPAQPGDKGPTGRGKGRGRAHLEGPMVRHGGRPPVRGACSTLLVREGPHIPPPWLREKNAY
jgi:hypothetical protein